LVTLFQLEVEGVFVALGVNYDFIVINDGAAVVFEQPLLVNEAGIGRVERKDGEEQGFHTQVGVGGYLSGGTTRVVYYQAGLGGGSYVFAFTQNTVLQILTPGTEWA